MVQYFSIRLFEIQTFVPKQLTDPQNTNIMSQLLMSSFSLTGYTDFRKLELQYCKYKDDNQELRARLTELEALYLNTLMQATQKQRENEALYVTRQQIVHKQADEKDKINRIINEIYSVLGKEQPKQSTHIGKHVSNSDTQIMLNYLVKQIKGITKELNNSKHQAKQVIAQIQQKQKAWALREQSFSQQIADLQLDLQQLQKLQSQLQLQNQRILHQNEQLMAQVKTYKNIAIEARNQNHKGTPKSKVQSNEFQIQFNQQDKDFATDLLSYQKQLLVKVYELVMESFKQDDIEVCLRKIYEAYQNVTSCFREKLQIQYDLSDLQCQYQKKKATGSKDMLVQLRKQINNFRKQLFHQKQLLYKHEQILQQRIKDLSGQAVHDNRLKNFTIGLQSKLFRRQKTNQNAKIQIQEYPKQQQPMYSTEFNKMMTGSVQFRPTLQADKIVQQMIQKDRQNLQKMLKQTRNQMRK